MTTPRNSGRPCLACEHPEAGELAKFLASGGSKSAAAVRFGLTQSAIQRHRTAHLRIRTAKKQSPSSDARAESTQPVRFDAKDPQSLVATTARLVDDALSLLEHAKRSDDRRTALQALREARDSLQLLMRVAGLLTSDGAVSIAIDARSQTLAAISAMDTDELRAAIERLSTPTIT